MKTRVNDVNLVITENQLKRYFWKKITEDDGKKTKRLIKIQVLQKSLDPAKLEISLQEKDRDAVS